MQTLADKLSNIELKVRQLALKLERLKNENNTLVNENENLKAELNKKDSNVSLMQDQVAKAQNVLDKRRESDPEHSIKLRKDIEQYINEVDKCIEWLNNN